MLALVAHENFLVNNDYSVIHKGMRTKRNTSNIRRKLEKMLSKKIGVFGGLMKNNILRQRAKTALKTIFYELSEEIQELNDISSNNFLQEVYTLVQQRNLLRD